VSHTECVIDAKSMKCVACGLPVLAMPTYRRCLVISPQQSTPNHGPGVEPMPSRSAPGFLEKVKNFATAAAGHVAAGMPMASDAEIIRRHDICLGCEFLQDNACTQCGCPVARVRGYVSKLSWADSECPVGKWGKATQKQH
jgi:hypothetical protein